MSPHSNRNFILGFAVIAAISLTFGILNFRKALPEIGIDFKISRKQALQNAQTYLESRQFDLAGFKKTIAFSGSGGDKLYIEKELGVERLTSISEDTISIWRWRARFFKPLQKLEYTVSIDPKGRIVGFRRELDEAAPGLSLDTLAARLLGEAFLSGPTGIDLEKWELVETETIERPKRRDYNFTYELKNFKVGEATYRLKVGLQGAEISGYNYQLREPEDWWRDWNKQRAQNELFSNIATGAMILTLIGVFYYFFRHVKKGRIPWKTGIALSIVLGAANFLMGINSIPKDLAWEPTTTSFGAFIIQQVVQSVIMGLMLGLTLILLYGAGEYLYRSDHPNKLSLPGIFSKRGMKSKEFFEATLMGYLLCAFDIGFITFFYIVGSKFGFWSPADIKYDESVSTWLPWIFPLAISLYAALTEEFWFRLFGISFFKRLTKSTWLAILIPAVIWAFLHSNYPQQPGYARGIELTIVGVIAGLVMMRFGIWATLVYHYVYDAVLIGLFLFRSQNFYFWTSGLIVCGFVLIPALIAGIAYLKRRKFEEVDDLLNRAILVEPEPVKPPIPVQEPVPVIQPTAQADIYSPSLSCASRRTALIIGLFGLVLLLLPSPRQFGDQFEYKIDRNQAIIQAKQILQKEYGVNPDEFKTGVTTRSMDEAKLMTFRFNTPAKDYSVSYLKNHASLEQAEEALLGADGRQLYTWLVFFKKPLDPTEYRVVVPMNGSQIYFFKIIADSVAGVDLPADSARKIANEFFASSVVNAADYHLVEEEPIKRPNRKDWYFIYESKEPIAGEAHIRQSVELLGDVPNLGTKWIKVPEEWKRLEQNTKAGAAVMQGIGILAIIGMMVLVLRSFGKTLKQGNVDWRDARILAIVLGIIAIFVSLLKLPGFWTNYDTAKPLWSVQVEWLMMTFISVVIAVGFALVIVALGEALNNHQSGASRRLLSRPCKNGWNWDDAAVMIAFAGGYLGWKSLLNWSELTFGLPLHTWETELPEVIGSYVPWLSGLFDSFSTAIFSSMMFLTVLILLISLIRKPIHNIYIVLILFLIEFGVFFGSAGNWTSGEILWFAVKSLLTIGLAYWALKTWMVGRIQSLVGATLIYHLTQTGIALTGMKGSSYQIEGWILIALAAIIFNALIIIGLAESRRRICL